MQSKIPDEFWADLKARNLTNRARRAGTAVGAREGQLRKAMETKEVVARALITLSSY